MTSLFRKISLLRLSSFSFLLGVFLGNLLLIDSFIIILSIIGAIGLYFFVNRYIQLLLITFVLLTIGIWRFSVVKLETTSTFLKSYYNKDFSFQGEIVERSREKLLYQELVVGELKTMDDYQSEKILGKILVRTELFPKYNYGQKITFTGKITKSEGGEEFDYQAYLKQLGIWGICNYPKIELLKEAEGNLILRWFDNGRSLIEKNINQFFSEPEASLLAGTILGIKRTLPEDFQNALQKTGTTHIVVVSGTNITMVLLLTMSLVSQLGKKKTLLLSFICVFSYVLLVGFDPPVLRAFLMFIPVLIARLYGRETDIFDSLILSASTILFFNPLLINNISFQLSFLSTLGLIWLVPIFQKIIKLPSFLEESIIVSLSAQMMTLPIIVFNFQEFSLVSLLVNLLVIPIVPIITYGGFLFIPLSFISKDLATLYSWFLFLPLTYFVRMVEFWGQFSWASITLKKIPYEFIVIYYLILGFFIYWSRKILSRDKSSK